MKPLIIIGIGEGGKVQIQTAKIPQLELLGLLELAKHTVLTPTAPDEKEKPKIDLATGADILSIGAKHN